jgi:streptogramin lyase
MSDPVGARFPRWIGTIATAAMAATAIVFTPLAAGASATVIAEFPIPTAGSTPQGITVGSDGNLWFAESTGGSRIGQITPAGAITEFTSLTGASFWITSGPGGNLWTTEPGANAIGELSTGGALVGEFTVPTPGSLPDQIAAGPDGNAWFTEYLGNQIGMITPAGVITEFPIPSAGAGPTAIVAGSDGNLWFAEQAGNRIGRITTAGVVTEFGPVGSLPAGMAAGPDGNVWFTEFNGNQIGRITMAGVITEYAVTTAGSAPASIAAGPDGNLWFTEYGANQIGLMSPAGAMLAEFPIPTAGSGPNGITTGPDGNLWFTEALMNQIGRLTPGTASDATALTYDGATTGDFNDPATVSATLVDTSTTPATPLSGQSVAFTLNGAETCTGVTDASGRAACQLTPAETSGAYAVIANFAGTAALNASSTSASFAVTVEETALALTAPAVIANGSSVSLSAVLTEDGKTPIAGRTVTLGLGTGDTAQQCTATTSATGAATCSIDAVNQPLGAGVLFATFAGDGFYGPASAGGASVVFAFVSGGMFVVGDGRAQVGGSVTFWSSKWADSNPMSGGSGPASFKGFATTMTPAAACGGTWTSTGGNSSNPPAGPLPAYMAVVVSSSVDKSGSTITGDIARIVIVKTDPGYAPDPGGTGTGTVVAVLCSAPQP